MKNLTQVFGWYGMIAIVLAYALINFNILTSNDIAYQLLNCSGALGLFWVSFKKHDYQPEILNLVWALIALVAILKIIF
jgi:hypothetical protein